MPEFRNHIDARAYWQEVQCKALRKGVRHPDECPKLTIQGIEWAIPPRGTSVRPKFVGGKVELAGTDDLDWPEIAATIAAADARDEATCPTCGQPTEAALEASHEFLVAGFALAARALRHQYDLTDDQLSDLLEFGSADLPVWTVELLAWASGVRGSRHGEET